jgi:hypothetical protein
LPDGRLLSLPIPDPQSPLRYADLRGDPPPARLLHALTGGKLRGNSRVHLDPDLDFSALPRVPGWRPLLGQMGAAQGHLAKQGVGIGDVFLFFGWFRRVALQQRRWRFVPQADDLHVIYGWLQVGESIWLGQGEPAPEWAAYHPHCFGERGAGNTLYLAADRLDLPGLSADLPGAGLFRRFDPALQLTGGATRSEWRLPSDFLPRGRKPLSYHESPARWADDGEFCRLQAAFRGQEFVLDLAEYSGVRGWLAALFGAGLSAGCR